MRFDGAKLKRLREGRCWDQHTLAEQARRHGATVNQSTVSRAEHGKKPSGQNLVALAAALEVEPRDLYEDDGEGEAASMTAATADSIYEALRAAIRTEVREAMKEMAAA